jgi:zinc protease
MSRVVLALVLGAIGCGRSAPRPPSDGVPWASSGVDWSTPPAMRDVAWRAPAIRDLRLDNGIRIVVVENHRLPLIAITALHHAAGSREDGKQLGRAALTVDVLANQEAGIAATIATDHASQELVTLAPRLRESFTSLAAAIRAPAFRPEHVEARKQARLAEISEHRGQSRRLAARAFDRIVFGAHAYAQPAEGDYSGVATLNERDLRDFWSRTYRPDRLTLVFAGDVTLETAREVVAAQLGDWRATTPPPQAPAALPAYKPQLAYVDVPGATEANVIIGRPAGAARDTASLAGDIANTILGGGVDGRLDRVLHGRLAVAFGASASFWRGDIGGSWAAAATFATDRAHDGIQAMLAIFEQTRATPPSDDELGRARADITTAVERSFETTHGAARAAVRLVRSELSLDTYEQLRARLDAVTAAQVQAALELSDLSIVVAGDWSKLRDALGTLGLPITQYEP